MAGTTMPAVRKRLMELVGNHQDAPADAVFYEAPPDDLDASIYVASAATAQVDDPTLKSGRRDRDEVYVLLVRCEAAVLGGSQYETDLQAARYLRAVDETLADYPTVSGADLDASQQVISARVSGWASDEGPLDRAGTYRVFVVSVRVHARIK